jgi:hypothetical protein
MKSPLPVKSTAILSRKQCEELLSVLKERFEKNMRRHKGLEWLKIQAKLEANAEKLLGGALFCDRRFDTVFVYHNGTESYYAARGFRAWIRV